ncbi:hypothetical protein [Cupriavidus basilensis]|uniref:hypothetical protein n=1 Tax=Cupriavidus basilensis TaxID=68895 RepID=UPI0020A6C88A|nr:hypothetical protein [Cupriavidus basilensis]MCP3024962.1 hypothetical protein [Cupriavidus basilensis]
MARAFLMQETAPAPVAKTARLGAGNTANDRFDEKEIGKFVKLVAESRYDLCAVGNEIEGHIVALEEATQGGFTIGSVQDRARKYVTFDGLQATPGTGVIAVGDYVVAGTVTAKGTRLSNYARVCKATSQTGQTYKWRVVSLGPVGTGAVGTVGLIERL